MNKMKPTEFFEKFNLHDSLVNNVYFKDQKLILDLDLCNWKQSNYREEQPEIINGLLTFSNAQEYETELKLFVPDSNEILEVTVTSTKENPALEQVKLVLTSENDVIIVNFKATGVFWETV